MMRLEELSRMGVEMMPGVVNHLWQSTLFAVAAGLVTVVLRGNSARARYRVWLIASVKFLLPFALLVGLGGYFARPRAEIVTQSQVDAVVDEMAAPMRTMELPVMEEAAPATLVVAPAQPEQPAMSKAEWAAIALTALWICGMVTVLGVWLVRWGRLLRVRKAAIAMPAGREVAVLRRMEEVAGAKRALPLLLSRERMEPGVLGVWRPVLLWPERISEHLEERHLEAIFTHELEHVRQHDNFFAMVQMFIEALLWFHPLVWWMGTRMVAERERACDEEVLRLGNAPVAYAESILKTCEFCVESPLACVAGITGADLKQRMVQIMSSRLGGRLSPAKKIMLGSALLAATIAPMVFGQRLVSLRIAMLAPVRPLERLWTPMMQSGAAASADGIYRGQRELYSLTGSGMRWWPMSIAGERVPVGLTDPRLLGAVSLSPPREVFAGKVEMKGFALVGLTVDQSGATTDVHVVHGLNSALDAAAVDAISKLRFSPAKLNGAPVPFALEIVADFDHVAITITERALPGTTQQTFHFFTESTRALPRASYRLEGGLSYGDHAATSPHVSVDATVQETLRFPVDDGSVVMQWLPPGLAPPAAGGGGLRFCAASYVQPDPRKTLKPEVRVERSCGAEYDAALGQALQRFWIVWPQPVTIVNVSGERREEMTSAVPGLPGTGFIVVTSDGRLGVTAQDLPELLQKMGAPRTAQNADSARLVAASMQLPANQIDPTGTWQGLIDTGTQQSPAHMVLKIFKGDDGEWHTRFYEDSGRPTLVSLIKDGDTGLLLQGRRLLFATAANGRTTEGTLSEDGTSMDFIDPMIHAKLVRAAPGSEWQIPDTSPSVKTAGAEPSFDVATIKPVDPSQNWRPLVSPRGRQYQTTGTTLRYLLEFAYGINGKQIAGTMPEWVSKQQYNIVATPGGEAMPTAAQWTAMLKKLLADRFQLKFHIEKRELPAYALVVGKNGTKLTPTSGGAKDFGPGMGFAFRPGGYEGMARNSTIDNFAEALQRTVLDRPVVDQTGLTGRYDINLSFSESPALFADWTRRSDQGVSQSPELFTAIQEQLGLRLDSVRTPVDVIVIDKVEQPSVN